MKCTLPRGRFLVDLPRSSGAVCLTFDDGPDPESTPLILDELFHLGIQATFFVVGQEAAKYPDIIRRMVIDGHEIGHHTYSHSRPAETSSRQLLEELRETDNLLYAIVGMRPKIVRPPYGSLTVSKTSALWRKGYTIALWNVDTKDYLWKSDQCCETWLKSYKAQPGDVVLMHDVRPRVANVLAPLANLVRGSSLRFARIDDRPSTQVT